MVQRTEKVVVEADRKKLPNVDGKASHRHCHQIRVHRRTTMTDIEQLRIIRQNTSINDFFFDFACIINKE